jgi:hypothetical protein
LDGLIADGFVADLVNLTLQQRIGKWNVQMSMSMMKLVVDIQGCDGITEPLNLLSQKAMDVPAFVLAVIHLIQVFLPVEQRLLIEIVKFFAQIDGVVNAGGIYEAMRSARFENNETAAMDFDCNEGLIVAFPVPFGPSDLIEVRTASEMSHVQGIEGLLNRFRGRG